MPFGLSNSPSKFQSSLYIILSEVLWQRFLIYLYYIIISSSSVEYIVDHVN